MDGPGQPYQQCQIVKGGRAGIFNGYAARLRRGFPLKTEEEALRLTSLVSCHIVEE